ncbi:MAG: arginine--tRNA ligase [Anaerolineales bacterium]|jgi:arginyl-tRNA synthetase
MFQSEQQAIEDKIKNFASAQGLVLATLEWKPIPFSGEWGISTSFFASAALEARAGKKVVVPQRAQEMALLVRDALVNAAGISRIEAVKGYLNLYFETVKYAGRVVETVLEQKSRFGSGPATGQRVMIEFSQPNTHKAFHVGHLRSAILGDALARIIEFAGYNLVRANYPGDMGLHVIKWLWAYIKYHSGEEPDTDITEWMGKVYADASRRLEENPDLEAEVRAVYARWDKRDPEVVALWEKTRQWSLEGFHQMYDQLDIRFDKYYFNSEEEDPGKQVVEQLVRDGIATDERPQGGAVLVKIDELLGLTKEQYRTTVVLRSDGTALYATEDLSLVLHKFRDYPDLFRSIYVVDVRQSLHFTQIFKILEIAGYEQARKCVHVAYELVTLPGNVVISSREGTVVLLEDLLREAISRARAEATKKNPNLSGEQLEAVAKAVGLGALKYPILARENTKLVTFDWQAALDFNGQAAPYIQYAHVRCNSILKKAGVTIGDLPTATFTYTLEPAEIELIDIISRFPDEVQRAATEYKPLVIASLAYDIAKAFAGFYDACPVVQADVPVRAARLRLVAATKYVLANALALLGITAPEVM